MVSVRSLRHYDHRMVYLTLVCVRGIPDSCICICIESNTGAGKAPSGGMTYSMSTFRIVTLPSVGVISELFQPQPLEEKMSLYTDYTKTVQGFNGATVRPAPKNTRHSSYTVIWRVLLDIVGNWAWSGLRIELGHTHMREQTCNLIIYTTIYNLNVCLITHMMWVIGNFYNCS